MNTRHGPADVIIAAGGLGTRVHPWSRFIPKEFYPVNQRPGILHLFDEIRAIGPARVHFVYHPYYEPFIAWIRQLLTGGAGRYDSLVRLLGQQRRLTPFTLDGLCVEFVAQSGPYSDLSSLLNGAHAVRNEHFLLAFADNLYPDENPLTHLCQANEPTILVRAFAPDEAGRRGLVVAPAYNGRRSVVRVLEKPGRDTALALASEWGEENLFMVEGRFALTREFVHGADHRSCETGGEPKLSLALGRYAREHPVDIVVTASRVIDLATANPEATAELRLPISVGTGPR